MPTRQYSNEQIGFAQLEAETGTPLNKDLGGWAARSLGLVPGKPMSATGQQTSGDHNALKTLATFFPLPDKTPATA